MSQETSTWLNTRTLIGFTDERGHAWHYRADGQGDEPNHYPGPVPVGDVQRRVFGWDAVTASVFVEYYNDQGFVQLSDQARKAVVRPAGAFGPDDAGAILGLFRGGYLIHQFREWLLGTVGSILDDGELSIGSAGLLKGGAVAWVSVEVADAITTPEGVRWAWRPVPARDCCSADCPPCSSHPARRSARGRAAAARPRLTRPNS
jgi:hypothetical protein